MEHNFPEKEPQTSFRGLYKNVKISVKTLDKVIVGGILILIALVLYGVANNGYTITFDSRGGTDVPAQVDMMYGDYVAEPEAPTREGYTFGGWFTDERCTYQWDFEESQVGYSITLYANWLPDNQT